MRWRGRRQSANIEDRRSEGGGFGGGFGGGMGGLGKGGLGLPPMGRGSGGRRAGGGGLVFLIIFVLVMWALGVNPLQLLQGVGTEPGTTSRPSFPGTVSQTSTQTAGTGVTDDMKEFVAVVLADTEDVWHEIFSSGGQTYTDPTLVLFTDSVRSACGLAGAATGPFYCPGDHKLYIDLGFYRELVERFHAPGDFAQAYVIAHEVGHHVQNLLGVLPKFNQMRQRMNEREANAMSVRVELQADCFAGVFAYYEQKRGYLEAGDMQEALQAAAAVGDDTIQKRTQGYVVPDSFNHGTAAQRQKWFQTGFQSGDVSSCDTFSPAEP